MRRGSTWVLAEAAGPGAHTHACVSGAGLCLGYFRPHVRDPGCSGPQQRWDMGLGAPVPSSAWVTAGSPGCPRTWGLACCERTFLGRLGGVFSLEGTSVPSLSGDFTNQTTKGHPFLLLKALGSRKCPRVQRSLAGTEVGPLTWTVWPSRVRNSQATTCIR